MASNTFAGCFAPLVGDKMLGYDGTLPPLLLNP